MVEPLAGQLGDDRDERPFKDLRVDAFSMGRTEVTVGWYLRCMAEGACEPPTWWTIGYFEDVAPHLKPAAWANLPVTGVSWRQAGDFCRWLGPGYALPTEAEWEYAAGAAKNWTYPWGDKPGDRYSEAAGRKSLTPVASTPANPLGLFDMGGSVWEWTADCYERKRGTEGCATRVSKGGSWSEHIWNLRVANKSYGLEEQGYKGLGFRVVYHEK